MRKFTPLELVDDPVEASENLSVTIRGVLAVHLIAQPVNCFSGASNSLPVWTHSSGRTSLGTNRSKSPRAT